MTKIKWKAELLEAIHSEMSKESISRSFWPLEN